MRSEVVKHAHVEDTKNTLHLTITIHIRREDKTHHTRVLHKHCVDDISITSPEHITPGGYKKIKYARHRAKNISIY